MSTLSAARPSASVVNGGHVNAIKEKAKLLSIYSMMATTAAGSGHPTSCMSAAELVAGVFFHAMKFDPKNANSNENDRFVLSKGHAAPLLYAALAEAGVFPVSRLDDAQAVLRASSRGTQRRGSMAWTPRQDRWAKGFRLARAWRSARGWIRARREFTCLPATANWRKGRCGKRLHSLPITTSII